MIETLLTKPYHVIDILPRQVPKNGAGHYPAIEQFFLKELQYPILRGRFARILLKLGCYYDMQICFADEDVLRSDLIPDEFVALITDESRDLCILLAKEETLFTLYREDTYMTVYNARGELLDTLEELVRAEGLFIWKPPQEG